MYKMYPFLCLVVLIALVSCVQPESDAIQLTANDAGGTFQMKEGDILQVTLEGNPTTGYTWEAAPDSSQLLVQQGEPEFKADSSALGSGGTMVLRFKAVQHGTGSLRLIYHRTFEPNVAPLKTFEATIVVG